jgi:hypothetical protein
MTHFLLQFWDMIHKYFGTQTTILLFIDIEEDMSIIFRPRSIIVTRTDTSQHESIFPEFYPLFLHFV